MFDTKKNNLSVEQKKLRIAYTPEVAQQNKYVANNISILEQIGCVTLGPTIKLEDVLSFKFDVFIVNWIENSTVDKDGNFKLILYLRLFLKCVMWRTLAKRVIYVQHNKFPHKLKRGRRLFSLLFKLTIIPIFHTVITHRPMIRRKYLPHPLYDDKSISQLSEESACYLFFGRLLPYKNIEFIINCFNESSHKIEIIGTTIDRSYFNTLERQITGNVKLKNIYLDDNKLSQKINKSKAIIIPTESESLIMSGTLIHALSHKKAVLMKENRISEWFCEKYPELPLYTYKNKEEFMGLLNAELKVSDALFTRFIHDHSNASIKDSWTQIINVTC